AESLSPRTPSARAAMDRTKGSLSLSPARNASRVAELTTSNSARTRSSQPLLKFSFVGGCFKLRYLSSGDGVSARAGVDMARTAPNINGTEIAREVMVHLIWPARLRFLICQRNGTGTQSQPEG